MPLEEDVVTTSSPTPPPGICRRSIRYRHPASAGDWEEQKDNFRRLYCDENRSLASVATEMKRLYGFDATERQYKQRIAQWHLDKKVKNEEMRAMLRLQQLRKGECKDSVFYVRGRPVDPKKMERFSKRKGNLEDRKVQGAAINLPRGVRCYTPPHQSGLKFVGRQDSLCREPEQPTVPSTEVPSTLEGNDIPECLDYSSNSVAVESQQSTITVNGQEPHLWSSMQPGQSSETEDSSPSSINQNLDSQMVPYASSLSAPFWNLQSLGNYPSTSPYPGYPAASSTVSRSVSVTRSVASTPPSSCGDSHRASSIVPSINIPLNKVANFKDSRVACFYVLAPGSDYYRAIYLYERTAIELTRHIAETVSIDPTKISRIMWLCEKGLQINIDDDVVQNIMEGQDMQVSISQVNELFGVVLRF